MSGLKAVMYGLVALIVAFGVLMCVPAINALCEAQTQDQCVPIDLAILAPTAPLGFVTDTFGAFPAICFGLVMILSGIMNIPHIYRIDPDMVFFSSGAQHAVADYTEANKCQVIGWRSATPEQLQELSPVQLQNVIDGDSAVAQVLLPISQAIAELQGTTDPEGQILRQELETIAAGLQHTHDVVRDKPQMARYRELAARGRELIQAAHELPEG